MTAVEFMLGWDYIAPLKARSWASHSANSKHKEADRLAAASEAFHVVGWSRTDMVDAAYNEWAAVAGDPTLDDASAFPAPAGFAAGSFDTRSRCDVDANSGRRGGPSGLYPDAGGGRDRQDLDP